MKVHQAVKVVFHGSAVLGRVWAIDGGVVTVRTPHGSEIVSGRVWVRELVDAADFDALHRYERTAWAVCVENGRAVL